MLSQVLGQARSSRRAVTLAAFLSSASLNDLVPEFVDRVPLAKYTLAFNEFHYYFTSKRGTHLFYVAMPPFGRRVYSFVRDQWTYLD